LDNLTWQLACKYSGPPPSPIPHKSPWREVAFPIVNRAADWKGSETLKLGLITNKRVRDRIKREQPFVSWKNRPERYPLAVLQELWNRDKHRSVHFVGSTVAFRSIGPPPENWHGQPLKLRLLWLRRAGPFESQGELVRFEITDPIVNDKALELYLEANVNLLFDIALQNGPPGFGQPVVATVQMLKDRATAILAKFESEFR
jgi:hypothetical protein